LPTQARESYSSYLGDAERAAGSGRGMKKI
jgi:hypothetical protein